MTALLEYLVAFLNFSDFVATREILIYYYLTWYSDKACYAESIIDVLWPVWNGN